MTVARCFVALRPDDAGRAALAALAQCLARAAPRARPVDADNLHLTLAFVGTLDLARAPAIGAALQSLDAPAIAWQLDRLGCFPRARVGWVAGPRAAALDELAASVRSALDRLGVAYDRRPFVPHVTLLRSFAPAGARALETPIVLLLGAPELLVSARDGSQRLRYRPWVRPAGDGAAAGTGLVDPLPHGAPR